MNHARLSKSASHRWILCPASVRLSEQVPERPSGPAAKAGTIVHAEFERIARGGTRELDHAVIAAVEELGYSGDWAREQLKTSLTALGRLLQRYGITHIALEHKVSAGKRIERADLWGTCDVAGLNEAGDVLLISDLKTGRGFVDPMGNTQLGLYALGVLAMLDEPERVKRVVLTILQPIIARDALVWECSLEELLAFEETVRAAAAMTDDPEVEPNPGPEQCRWCPARKVCPAV